MNKPRRAQLDKLSTRLDDLRADLENVRDDEQSAFDQMPKSFPEWGTRAESRERHQLPR